MATTLTFTDDELVVLDQALAELPYRVAAPLVAAINEQLAQARGQAVADLDAERNRNRDASNALPLIET